MNFVETPLEGAWLLKPERLGDSRGYFARAFCCDEFGSRGLVTRWPQHNQSFNTEKGTLRGLHYQRDPYGETKVVRCTAGALWDVIVDLRENSPTRFQSYGVELSANNGWALYIPSGFLHGFQSLTEETALYYLMSASYTPQAAAGYRWDDPRFGIDWPLPVGVISPKDENLPYWVPS